MTERLDYDVKIRVTKSISKERVVNFGTKENPKRIVSNIRVPILDFSKNGNIVEMGNNSERKKPSESLEFLLRADLRSVFPKYVIHAIDYFPKSSPLTTEVISEDDHVSYTFSPSDRVKNLVIFYSESLSPKDIDSKKRSLIVTDVHGRKLTTIPADHFKDPVRHIMTLPDDMLLMIHGEKISTYDMKNRTYKDFQDIEETDLFPFLLPNSNSIFMTTDAVTVEEWDPKTGKKIGMIKTEIPESMDHLFFFENMVVFLSFMYNESSHLCTVEGKYLSEIFIQRDHTTSITYHESKLVYTQPQVVSLNTKTFDISCVKDAVKVPGKVLYLSDGRLISYKPNNLHISGQNLNICVGTVFKDEIIEIYPSQSERLKMRTTVRKLFEDKISNDLSDIIYNYI
jgi:hypothetical protein